MLSKFFNYFRRAKQPPPFDIEKALGHYLLTLPRCTSRVAVVSRRYLDKRYNYELTVDTSNLTAWAEKQAKGSWSSDEPTQAARLALPLWLRLADLSDNAVTLAPKEFFDIWHGYQSEFHEMPNSQVYCYDCGTVVNEITKSSTQLPPRDIFDVWKYEWRCSSGHLLYQEEIRRHADSRSFSRQDMIDSFIDEGEPIPSFLRKQAD
jgi:hypothetical protein